MLRRTMRRPSQRGLNILSCIQGLLLIALVGGCQTWVTQPGGAEGVSATQEEGPIRVTRADKSTITLFNVTVSSDSLIGFTKDLSTRVAIPLSEVNKVERRQGERPLVLVRNYFLIVGTIGIIALALALR